MNVSILMNGKHEEEYNGVFLLMLIAHTYIQKHTFISKSFGYTNKPTILCINSLQTSKLCSIIFSFFSVHFFFFSIPQFDAVPIVLFAYIPSVKRHLFVCYGTESDCKNSLNHMHWKIVWRWNVQRNTVLFFCSRLISFFSFALCSSFFFCYSSNMV